MIAQLSEIRNFWQLSDQIATAGQPTPEQFPAIRSAGYQTVVNLVPSEAANALPNESAIVAAQGMEYVQIPVRWEKPTRDDFSQFATVIQGRRHQPVFVHCAANMRVSAFMYLYRRLYAGVSEAQAASDLHQIWIPNPTWQDFIDQVIADQREIAGEQVVLRHQDQL
ncbi:protein tyrosine phosphatase family protein [Neosynechococcus sphagnicola]|uniref:protein tyrosine phosphatase family protein n=1 Tax=Neosynechococcus sphagnicola TaxID=1501145 RepID=UPI000565F813|nr:protein tyrosine phosphatase family protein [Neosynechococcus sphagnicola]